MQVPHLEVDPTEGIPISSNAQGNESINLLYLIEADLSRSFLHIFQRALRVVESIGQRRLSFSQFIGHIVKHLGVRIDFKGPMERIESLVRVVQVQTCDPQAQLCCRAGRVRFSFSSKESRSVGIALL